MSRVYGKAYFWSEIVPIEDAALSVTSSAILYGLSVYTVLPVCVTKDGLAAFRIPEHFNRLIQSARVMGIDTFEPEWTEERFTAAIRELVAANDVREDVFVRATVHVTAKVAGVRSRGLATTLSIFIYEAAPILPQTGARLKTSVWRRVSDAAIPSRAKVNGAYVNSVLAKQDALDSGYDDCIFLDTRGHVCELSAANIFIVRGGTLLTPGPSSDILEGINRRTVLEVARDHGIPVQERDIDLTELYIADEVFACGTSAYVAPVIEVDKRTIGNGSIGPITTKLRDLHAAILHGKDAKYANLLTRFQLSQKGVNAPAEKQLA
ncbi:branched-chain-amino-acid transaminase [Candidatus Kaiserbacteria bacterium RIFCSPLOWO2_12_FULL_52_8]|nr:MAG: branched-chain-amino-acid transaminase [Candidatus Kaiserbacteria bacterium RIFCSPLOWO2_12_FULL_52_8]